MSQSLNQNKSVLPPDMQASLKSIQKTFFWFFLLVLIWGIFLNQFLLRQILDMKSGATEDLILLYAITGGYIYAALLLTQYYIQHVSEKRGFVCPRCHKSLFQVLSKNNKIATTGRCPSCNYQVVQNAGVASMSSDEQKKPGGWRRVVRIVGTIVIVIAVGVLRYEARIPHNSGAVALLQKKSYDQAIAELNKEIQVNPNNGEALALRGYAYKQKDMKTEALSDLNRAISIAPNNYLALVARCGLETDTSSYDAALADCNYAIQVKPGPLEPYLYRATVYVARSQYDLAETDINQVIKRVPTPGQAQAPLYALRGDIFLSSGRLDDARQDFEKSKSLDPNAFGLFAGRGELEALQGAYTDAIPDLENAVKQIPFDPGAMIWLYLAKFHTGQDGQAELQQMRGGLKKQEWPSSVIDLYAGQATVDAVRAQAAIGDPSTLTEQACEADYYLGEYYLQQKDRDKAKASLQTGITSCPPNNSVEKQATLAEFKTQGF